MKYAGNVGYIVEKMEDGVFLPESIEKFMTGDIITIRKGREAYDNSSKVNEDISLSNRISLVGDAFAHENFMWIRWIEWQGVKWRVNGVSVETNAPRIVVTLGGVYVLGN